MPTGSILYRSLSVLFAAILCAGMVYFHLGIFVPRATAIRAGQGFGDGYSFGNDFYPIWLTSREALLRHRNPYGPGMTQEIQIGLFGRSLDNEAAAPADYRAFSYPAFVDFLFWPLATLPFALVRIVMAVSLALLTALSVLLWIQALHLRASFVALLPIVLFTLSSYGVLEGIYAGQTGLLVGFLLAASMAALAAGSLFFSGALLGLTLIKPQMMGLVGSYLLLWSLYRWRVRWRFAVGFLAVGFLLFAASLLVWPRWIGEWLGIVLGYRRYSTPPLISFLLGERAGRHLGPFLIAAILLASLVLALRKREALPGSLDFSATISLLLAATVITTLPGHAVYDHILLLPAILMIALSWRSFAIGKVSQVILALTAVAVFWQWITALVVDAVYLVSIDGASGFYVMLPLRTAASIPFAVIGTLGVMMLRAGFGDDRKTS